MCSVSLSLTWWGNLKAGAMCVLANRCIPFEIWAQTYHHVKVYVPQLKISASVDRVHPLDVYVTFITVFYLSILGYLAREI